MSQLPVAGMKAENGGVNSRPKPRGFAVLKSRDFYVFYLLLCLLAFCSLFYYFGELVDLAGWQPLHRAFFYGVHDVHRMLFLAPIIYAGHFYRVKGAVIVSLLAFAIFVPRAVLVSPFADPLLRPVLFTIIAVTIGTLTGIIRNQSERRSLLEALLRSERDRFWGMLDRMRDGVVVAGPDYTVRFVNPSMVRDFGEGVGRKCYEYLQGLDLPCDETCKMSNVASGATESWECSLRGGMTYEIVGSPIVDSDGVTCALATFRNITQRKQLEMELIELNRLKSELLSNVSHELRSPLTSIKGIISSLLQEDIELDHETRQMLLGGVGEETDRLASLVTKLLDMSKLEAGVWKPEKESCRVSDIIDEVLERQKWVHKNRAFDTNIEADLPQVFADYGQVRQVLTNLVENAAAYSDETTRIAVQASSDDSGIRVCVSDEGVGIPEEELEKVFEKFYRGSQRRTKPGGTGLGLAICQAIVLAHGGRIWAESELGRGSTFCFTLPVTPPPSEGQD